ncbi:MAG: histidine kinase [Gammaproteobacteria bacterium]|jgi:two-component system LytT family sensor kinase|nr:histidine kinase [Gammaproteobacteria bacterium]
MLKNLLQHRRRLFWLLQISGWAGYALMNFLQGLAYDRTPIYIIPSLVYALSGFCLTLVMRQIYLRIWNQPPLSMFTVAVLSSLLFAVVFEASRVLAYLNLYPSDWQIEAWWEVFRQYSLSLYVLLAWSALYFGIKYYRKVEQQRAQLLEATTAAQTAQLKMLRYQLNPHFLFNTLNAVSTLILAGQNDTANRMVVKLSHFLRRSLEMEPMQMVSLRDELQAIREYLEVEQIRFAERLSILWDVDEQAYSAQVPSLLLQPIIENAIKYAIAPSVDGGHIEIKVSLLDETLHIVVQDDGPGLDHQRNRPSEASGTGLGLENIRARLRALHGDMQSVIIEDAPEGGVRVSLQMPYEHE